MSSFKNYMFECLEWLKINKKYFLNILHNVIKLLWTKNVCAQTKFKKLSFRHKFIDTHSGVLSKYSKYIFNVTLLIIVYQYSSRFGS